MNIAIAIGFVVLLVMFIVGYVYIENRQDLKAKIQVINKLLELHEDMIVHMQNKDEFRRKASKSRGAKK